MIYSNLILIANTCPLNFLEDFDDFNYSVDTYVQKWCENDPIVLQVRSDVIEALKLRVFDDRGVFVDEMDFESFKTLNGFRYANITYTVELPSGFYYFAICDAANNNWLALSSCCEVGSNDNTSIIEYSNDKNKLETIFVNDLGNVYSENTSTSVDNIILGDAYVGIRKFDLDYGWVYEFDVPDVVTFSVKSNGLADYGLTNTVDNKWIIPVYDPVYELGSEFLGVKSYVEAITSSSEIIRSGYYVFFEVNGDFSDYGCAFHRVYENSMEIIESSELDSIFISGCLYSYKYNNKSVLACYSNIGLYEYSNLKYKIYNEDELVKEGYFTNGENTVIIDNDIENNYLFYDSLSYRIELYYEDEIVAESEYFMIDLENSWLYKENIEENYFVLRVEGGFKPNSDNNKITGTDFSDQEDDNIVLYQNPYKTKTFTIGSGSGVDEAMREKLTNIFALNDLSINFVRMTKANGTNIFDEESTELSGMKILSIEMQVEEQDYTQTGTYAIADRNIFITEDNYLLEI